MYEVNIQSNPDATFSVKSKGYEFIVGIKDKGISPPDILLASLGSCLGVYVRKYAEGAGLDLKGFSLKVSAEFSKGTPVYFKHINVSLKLWPEQIDERRRKACLEFIKNCPVHNTLKNNPEVKIEFV